MNNDLANVLIDLFSGALIIIMRISLNVRAQCINNHTILCSMESIIHYKIKSGKTGKAFVCPFPKAEKSNQHKIVVLILITRPVF
jgi:hypothetical protein